MTFLAILWLITGLASAGTPCPKKVEDRKSPCTASPKEQEKIMKLINRGVTAYGRFEDEKIKEANLRKEILSLEQQGLEPSFQLRDSWQKSFTALRANQQKMQAGLNEAANLTSLYYGLGRNSRDIANGPLERREARWKPQFAYAAKGQDGNYESIYRKLTLQPENEAHYQELYFGKVGDGVQAYTLEDGSVNISIEAFQLARDKGSPRLLAKTIYHEGIHFDDLVGGGWKYSREAMEPDAYERTFKAAHVFELKRLERETVQEQWMRATVRRVQVDVGTAQATPSFSAPAQRLKAGEQFETRLAADLAAEGQQRALEEGFEAAREAMARGREERRLGEERRKLEEEKRRKEEAGLRSLEFLRGLADKACSMGRVDRTFLEDVPLVSDSGFYCENAPKIMSADDDCARRIYGAILDQLCRQEVLSSARINDALEVYRPRLGPVEAGGLGEKEQEEAAKKQRDYAFQQVQLSWDWLRGKSSRACADPASLTNEDVPVFRTAYLRLRDSGPQFRVSAPENAAVGRLDGCAKDLLLRIIQNEREGLVISGEGYRRTAAEIAAVHGPSPEPGPDSDGTRDQRGGRSPSRVGDGSGPSKDKAEKINRGKWPR